MAARMLDGAAVARVIRDEIRPGAEAFAARAGRPPGLGVVLVAELDQVQEARAENLVAPPAEQHLGVAPELADHTVLVFGISLFRRERVPVAEAMRITVICSLVQFSTRGDDVARTLGGLIPDPPAGSTDL